MIKYINFSDDYPQRKEFLRNSDDCNSNELLQRLNSKQPLNIHPIEVRERDRYLDFANGIKIYYLTFYGIMENGTKLFIEVEGVLLSFLIKSKNALNLSKNDLNTDNTDEIKSITKLLSNNKIRLIEIKSGIKGKPFIYFQEHEDEFIKLSFNTIEDRKNAIELLRNNQYDTFLDDYSGLKYYYKISREKQLYWTDWIEISKYRIITKKNYNNIQCISVHIDNMRSLTDEEKAFNRFQKIPSMTLTWDIETSSYRGASFLPMGYNFEDKLRMICGTLHYEYDEKVLMSYIILYNNLDLSELIDKVKEQNYYVIKCKNELEVIYAFGKLIKSLRPDFVGGFNDGQYDWPFIIEKLQWYSINKPEEPIPLIKFLNIVNDESCTFKGANVAQLCERLINCYFRKRNVKITQEKSHEISMLISQGTIYIDLRVMFMRIYNRAEVKVGSSLNFYLEKNGLAKKEDVNNLFMQTTFAQEHPDTKDIARIAYYCVGDSMRCHWLCMKRTRIHDLRESAKYGFVCFNNAFYNASGVKIKNCVAGDAERRGIYVSFTHRSSNSGSYKGAYVFPPKKGLHNRRPVTGVDASSLYPSIMMAFNMSPEKLIGDPLYAQELIDRGIKLTEHTIEKYVNVQTENGEEKVEIVIEKAFTIFHHNKMENMGIVGTILKWLYDTRAKMKVPLGLYEDKKKLMEKEGKTNCDEYRDVVFRYNKINAEQLALKIFMNTFYGELGNPNSILYLTQIAGGITMMGQRIIQEVARFSTEEYGANIVYGDTDSCYLCCPEHVYKDVDEQYSNNEITKLEYWQKMVAITMITIADLVKVLNEHLINFTETPYIKMAYEEVLFPLLLISKKKYVGIPHTKIENINFDVPPERFFYRGIEIIKRGKSEFLKKSTKELLAKMFNVDFAEDIIELVKSKISELINRKWEISDFKLSAEYKKPKEGKPGNVSVLTFINRYNDNEDNHIKIQAGERFEYVVVKKDLEYTRRQTKHTHKKGEQMELYEDALKNNMEVSFDHYITSEIIGQFCRFIVFYEMFEIDESSLTYKERDNKMKDKAKKYLQQYYKSIRIGDEQIYDKSRGKEFRRIERQINCLINEELAGTSITKLIAKKENMSVVDIIKGSRKIIDANIKRRKEADLVFGLSRYFSPSKLGTLHIRFRELYNLSSPISYVSKEITKLIKRQGLEKFKMEKLAPKIKPIIDAGSNITFNTYDNMSSMSKEEIDEQVKNELMSLLDENKDIIEAYDECINKISFYGYYVRMLNIISDIVYGKIELREMLIEEDHLDSRGIPESRGILTNSD
jgi:DNA polymerase elongation subunit (family B)